MPHVRNFMKALSGDGKRPPVELFVLTDILGIPSVEIAEFIERSANQVSYYRSGITPIPDDIRSGLRKMLKESEEIIRKKKLTGPEETVRKGLLAAIELAMETA